jgi:hypothetical protein
MPTKSLTAASVARIKPPKAGQVDISDRGYPGLALRLSYGGSKSWVYFYRLHGKLRRMSLGRYPGMSLTEARDAWRGARLAVSKGESPAHIRPTTADSFRSVAEEWLKRDQAQNRSAADVRRAIAVRFKHGQNRSSASLAARRPIARPWSSLRPPCLADLAP